MKFLIKTSEIVEECGEVNSLLVQPSDRTLIFPFLPREWGLLTLEITQEAEMLKVAASKK